MVDERNKSITKRPIKKSSLSFREVHEGEVDWSHPACLKSSFQLTFLTFCELQSFCHNKNFKGSLTTKIGKVGNCDYFRK